MTQAGLCFDEVAHRYTLNGVAVPNITFVLEHCGFVDKRWFPPDAAQRGRAVHAACQFLIENDLDWSTVDPAILPRVQEFERFLDHFKPRLILAEKPLASKLYSFAGTPDLVLDLGGVMTVVDIKSGASGLAAKLQTAAQKILVEEAYPAVIGKIGKRFALELPADGKYQMVQHSDMGDKVMFLNAVAMIHRRLNEREISL